MQSYFSATFAQLFAYLCVHGYMNVSLCVCFSHDYGFSVSVSCRFCQCDVITMSIPCQIHVKSYRSCFLCSERGRLPTLTNEPLYIGAGADPMGHTTLPDYVGTFDSVSCSPLAFPTSAVCISTINNGILYVLYTLFNCYRLFITMVTNQRFDIPRLVSQKLCTNIIFLRGPENSLIQNKLYLPCQ